MRTLKFIVDGQVIRQDPDCDFNNLVPDTEGYLKAEFKLSKEWDDYVKVASFWSAMGKEYMPQVLNSRNIVNNCYCCIIPKEALKKRVFKVQIVGRYGGITIKTNKVAVSQNGGK